MLDFFASKRDSHIEKYFEKIVFLCIKVIPNSHLTTDTLTRDFTGGWSSTFTFHLAAVLKNQKQNTAFSDSV